MARSQRPLLLILPLLAVGAAFGAWWLQQSLAATESISATETSSEQSRDPRPEPARVDVEPLTPATDMDSTETTVAWPVQVELELVEPADLPSAEGVPALGTGATASLAGKVQNAAGGPVPGARIEFVAGPNKGREIVANEGGEFGAVGLFPGLAIARVQGPGTPGALREVRLRKGVETLLNLSFMRPSQVWITVHDDEGEVLEGVEVRVDGQVGRTDEYGDVLFTAMTPGLAIVVELEKEGFASQASAIGVSLGYDIPKGKLQYRLSKACSLEVIVSSSAGGKGDAVVVVMPDNPLGQSANATTSLGGHASNPTDYPWYRVSPATVRPGGRVVFDDLPQLGVHVRVFHEGAEMEQRVLSANLKPTKPQTLSVALKPAPRLVGKVTLDGEAVADARVVLEAPDRTAATLQYFSESWMFLESMPIPELPVAREETRSDPLGGFVLSTWPKLARARYLRVTSRDRRYGATRLVTADTENLTVELEPISAGDGRIEVEFPGRLQGLPVSVRVNGEPRPEVVLPASENLVLDGLTAGTWSLTARWHGTDLVVPPATFELHDVALQAVPLPEGAILGQDQETFSRARGL